MTATLVTFVTFLGGGFPPESERFLSLYFADKGQMGRHSIRTAANDATFFAALENGHAVAKACATAGYKRQVAYRWRAEDAAFDKRWCEALDVAGDLLEGEADQRGRDGVDQPVFHRGRNVGAKRKYSDGLLMARLKAVRPELYREQIVVPSNGPRPVIVNVRDFEAEAALVRLMREKKLSASDLSEGLRARLLDGTGDREREGYN